METIQLKKVHHLEGHSSDVNSCQFSPDGKFIATASYDKTVKLWRVDTGECIHTFTGHTQRVVSCCFSFDGKLLASSSWDNTIILRNVETRIHFKTMNDSTEVYCCAFSPHSDFIVSGGRDNDVKIWYVEQGKCFKILKGHE